MDIPPNLMYRKGVLVCRSPRSAVFRFSIKLLFCYYTIFLLFYLYILGMDSWNAANLNLNGSRSSRRNSVKDWRWIKLFRASQSSIIRDSTISFWWDFICCHQYLLLNKWSYKVTDILKEGSFAYKLTVDGIVQNYEFSIGYF